MATFYPRKLPKQKPAALEMQEDLRKLCDKWRKEGRGPLQIGTGTNSGNAIVGNIGSAA